MFLVKQLLLTLLLALLINHSDLLYAHAVVTKSSLDIAPVAANQATQIKLNFNSKIELSLSQLYLVREGDVHEPLHAIKGRSPGLIIIDLPALQKGEYAIRLKVFAADGHLTEDIIRFVVKPMDTK